MHYVSSTAPVTILQWFQWSRFLNLKPIAIGKFLLHEMSSPVLSHTHTHTQNSQLSGASGFLMKYEWSLASEVF